MKKSIFIVFILIGILLPIPLAQATTYGAELGGDFEILGDAVVVDDDRAYLSAEPHTIGSSGWVEFTLISKQFSGDIDVVFGFNQTVSRPAKPQIWANYSHTLYRWVEVEKTAINETTGEEFNYTGWDKEYYESWFFDWKPMNKKFTKKLLDAKGMDTWYILKNVYVEEGKEYRLRCWVEIPFAGLDTVRGKYAWGIKLSSNTIQEAIDHDRFYFIDPWYDSSWSYRIEVTADSGDIDEVLTNFTVMVFLNSSRIDLTEVQDDLDDIRFTSDDKVTLLSYEIEDYTVNTNAWLWVRQPTWSNITDPVFYIYYGNALASSGEDVEGTWDPSAVMVQHLQEATGSTCVDSTVYDNDGTPGPVGDPPVQVSGQIGGALSFDGVDDYGNCGADTSLDITDEITIAMWVNMASTGLWMHPLQKLYGYQFRNYGETGRPAFYLDLDINGFNGIISTGALNVDEWHLWVGTYRGTEGYMRIYIDGVLNNTSAQMIDTIDPRTTQPLKFAEPHPVDGLAFFHGMLDKAVVFNEQLTAAQIKATYESERDHLLTFGSEEVPFYLTIYYHSGIAAVYTNGTLRANGTDVAYEIGEVASVTSIVDSGYSFFKYIYDTISTLDNPLFITMDGNYTCTAHVIEPGGGWNVLLTYTVLLGVFAMGLVKRRR